MKVRISARVIFKHKVILVSVENYEGSTPFGPWQRVRLSSELDCK